MTRWLGFGMTLCQTGLSSTAKIAPIDMKYRPEIDGLKALAMMAVVLFHAGFGWFKGGFVGVDVFFCDQWLSDCNYPAFSPGAGHLFFTRVLRATGQTNFAGVVFWSWRCRWWAPGSGCPPPDMADFSESLVASSYFVSNILFWLETGYWGTTNELKPLLHTWTLGIEAQFYLIFPVLMLVMMRFGRRWIPLGLISLGIISFLASQWGAYHLPSANFFFAADPLLGTADWGRSWVLFVTQKARHPGFINTGHHSRRAGNFRLGLHCFCSPFL